MTPNPSSSTKWIQIMACLFGCFPVTNPFLSAPKLKFKWHSLTTILSLLTLIMVTTMNVDLLANYPPLNNPSILLSRKIRITTYIGVYSFGEIVFRILAILKCPEVIKLVQMMDQMMMGHQNLEANYYCGEKKVKIFLYTTWLLMTTFFVSRILALIDLSHGDTSPYSLIPLDHLWLISLAWYSTEVTAFVSAFSSLTYPIMLGFELMAIFNFSIKNYERQIVDIFRMVKRKNQSCCYYKIIGPIFQNFLRLRRAFKIYTRAVGPTLFTMVTIFGWLAATELYDFVTKVTQMTQFVSSNDTLSHVVSMLFFAVSIGMVAHFGHFMGQEINQADTRIQSVLIKINGQFSNQGTRSEMEEELKIFELLTRGHPLLFDWRWKLTGSSFFLIDMSILVANSTCCYSTLDQEEKVSSLGYKVLKNSLIQTDNGFKLNLIRIAKGPSRYGKSAQILQFQVEQEADYRLRIKIMDVNPRFQVPIKINPAASVGNSNPLYKIEYTSDPLFTFRVIRRSSGTVLFDSSLGLMTFDDQFIQISTKLASKNLYGIGENEQPSFRHNFDKTRTWALWARDQPPDNDANMYGVHPHYTILENDGHTHAVVMVNSNAQEFTVTPDPGLSYRSIGGIFDMLIFFGPTPENVVEQYTEAVGRYPLPSYWSLGFQLCKYGYNDLATMQEVVDRTRAAKIPQDVQYGDIDIMDRRLDFTVSPDRFKGLPAYVKELKTHGIKFVTILDPAISMSEPPGSYKPYELGNKLDVWIKRADGSNAVGKVWPDGPVHFPDFSKNVTRNYWIELIKEFHDLIEFDGLWIDMNEPANFHNGDIQEGAKVNRWNNPPYLPNIRGDSLASRTLCPDNVTAAGRLYDTHSLYGWFQSEPTRAGLLASRPGKRAVVLSRSTFLGSGQWVAHWLGDNFSEWSNLHFSIIGMLQFGQFGIPFNGVDIGGFHGEATESLCQRWQELGAFYPFSRNHNVIGARPQDPAVWGAAVSESSRKALEIRYTLLPYLYTLFYDHMTKGGTVARALWHEFPRDTQTHGIDTQFLWGKGFMISPILEKSSTQRHVYFPADARWFDWYDGSEVMVRGQSVLLDVPMDHILLHLRGGLILPTQEPALNTQLSRQNPLGLVIAPNDEDRAEGHLYYDDGDSVDSIESGRYYLAQYFYQNGQLETIIEHHGWSTMSQLRLNTIRLLGNNVHVNCVSVNGKRVPLTVTQFGRGEVKLVNLNLDPSQKLKIKFS